jgi:hypothetical protein
VSRADYAHWNEEADYVWWQEEGRHDEAEFDPQNDDEGYSSRWDEEREEHDSTDDCLATGDLSKRRDQPWVCDHCDRELTDAEVARGFASHAPSEQSSGQ